MRIINHDSKRCQGGIESGGYVPEAVQVAQRRGSYMNISLWGMKRIMKYIRLRSQPPSKLLDKQSDTLVRKIYRSYDHGRLIKTVLGFGVLFSVLVSTERAEIERFSTPYKKMLYIKEKVKEI